MADLTYIYLKDVRPGMKNLNIVFIVLEIGLLSFNVIKLFRGAYKCVCVYVPDLKPKHNGITYMYINMNIIIFAHPQ